MSKCIGGGADGGCADGTSGGDGSVVLKIDRHCSNDCFAGTLVLCRVGDRAGAGVSFLPIFGRGFRGGSFHAIASGGVFVARTFSNFGSGGVCGAGSEYCRGICGAGIEEASLQTNG